jgi:hypothetical protein
MPFENSWNLYREAKWKEYNVSILKMSKAWYLFFPSVIAQWASQRSLFGNQKQTNQIIIIIIIIICPPKTK